jgi:hypothetical protein
MIPGTKHNKNVKKAQKLNGLSKRFAHHFAIGPHTAPQHFPHSEKHLNTASQNLETHLHYN